MVGRLFVKTTLALLLALAVGAAPAAADPIGGGYTSLKLNRHLYSQLKANDVTVQGLKPAKGRGRTVTLPVSSGLLESTYGSGYLFYKGGLRLRAGHRKVVLRNLLLNTEEDWLRGKIGETKLQIATGENRHARRDGFDKIAVALDLKLSKRAADVLNRQLGLRGLFVGGRPLGAAASVARRDQVTVSGGTIYLAIDEGFNAQLKSLEVEIRPHESATQVGSSPQTIALLNVHGFVGPDLSWGHLESESGVLLKREGEPGRQAFVWPMSLGLETDTIGSGLWLDPSPPLPGMVSGGLSLAAVDFRAEAMQIDQNTGSITAPGTPATLTAEAAARLNETFAPPGEPAFSAGEPFAAVSFTAETH